MPRRDAALAAATAFASMPGLYALVRLAQHRLEPEPDPAVIVMTAHSALFTALTVTGFLGASCALGAVALARFPPPRLTRIAAGTGLVSATLLAVYVATAS